MMGWRRLLIERERKSLFSQKRKQEEKVNKRDRKRKTSSRTEGRRERWKQTYRQGEKFTQQHCLEWIHARNTSFSQWVFSLEIFSILIHLHFSLSATFFTFYSAFCLLIHSSIPLAARTFCFCCVVIWCCRENSFLTHLILDFSFFLNKKVGDTLKMTT